MPACCAPAGVGHSVPHPAPSHGRLADRRAGTGGARHPGGVDAGERPGVLGRLDGQGAVRSLGLGELGGREAVEVAVARHRVEGLLRPRHGEAQQRPGVALEDLAVDGAQQRRCERRRAHDDLLAGLHVEAVAAEQGGERVGVEAAHGRIAAARHQPADAPATFTGRQETV
jgi:hypothetical protein